MTNFEIGPDTPQPALDAMEKEQQWSLDNVEHSPSGRARVLRKLGLIAFENLGRVHDAKEQEVA